MIGPQCSGWLAAGCDVCPAAPNCRCDTRTFVSSLLNQHVKRKWGINVGQSALISGNKIVGTIRAVRVTAVSSVTSQLTWQLYTLHPQQLPAVNPCHWAAGCWPVHRSLGGHQDQDMFYPQFYGIMKCIGSSSHHYPNKHTPYSHSHVLMLRSDSPPISPLPSVGEWPLVLPGLGWAGHVITDNMEQNRGTR